MNLTINQRFYLIEREISLRQEGEFEKMINHLTDNDLKKLRDLTLKEINKPYTLK